MFIPFQEQELYRYWLSHARSGTTLKDGKHRLTILEPGILNRHQGPDFIHSRFSFDGLIFQGSVEMHVSAADWYAHHHHLDPAFADVLLHVVAPNAADNRDVQHKQSARLIPTFRLPVPSLQLADSEHCPIQIMPLNPEILWALADKRLENKIHYFVSALSCRSSKQLFFSGLFHVAGYPHNTAAFDLLAANLLRVPALAGLSFFARLALSAGCAGFLQHPSPDAYSRLLGLTFTKYFSGQNQPLSPKLWKMGGCRPVNHPHFRLAGLAKLLEREAFDELMALLALRLPYLRAWHRLINYLKIPVSDYWAHHSALSRSINKKRKFFFGNARATELIINLLLPLAIAQARQRGSLGFESYLRVLYQRVPAALNYGRLARRYDWYVPFLKKNPFQGLGQGVLALEQDFCNNAACALCPLSPGSQQKLKAVC